MSALALVRLALLGLTATPATSPGIEYITGANFSAYCASADWETACKTYALGLLQGSQRRFPTICLPNGVDMDRLYAMGMDYIRMQSARGHEPACLLLLEAWELSFPCGS